MEVRKFLNIKLFLFILFLLMIYVVSVLGSYFYFTLSKVHEASEQEDWQEDKKAEQTSSFDLSPIPTPVEPVKYNFLLLGYGGEGHSGGSLADSMVVVHVDPDAKRAALISVPRDIWITLPKDDGTKTNRKLNHAYALGGGKLAKDAVSTVIGMPINYYAGLSFEGLKQSIDQLGGVSVNVPVAFDDYWYPVKGKENDACGKTVEDIEAIMATMSGFAGEKQFPCRYEHLHFDKGVVEMDGETALKFVRSRHSAQHGGDFARSQRQFALILGIRDKILTLGALDDVVPFFNKFSSSVNTDLEPAAAKMLVEVFGSVSEYSVTQIQLTEENVLDSSRSVDGQSILLPKAGEGNWSGIHKFVKDEMGKSI